MPVIAHSNCDLSLPANAPVVDPAHLPKWNCSHRLRKKGSKVTSVHDAL